MDPTSGFGGGQTIKIEVSEELEGERKKFQKKTLLAIAGTALLAGALGFAWGTAAKAGDATKRAQRGAGELERTVKAASEKLAELKAKVDGGMATLQKKEYPEALSKELGGLTIPFDASYLENKGVGNYNGALQKKVFGFSQAVTQLNERKEELGRILGGAKAPVEKYWRDSRDKMVNVSVVFRNQEGKGVVAELVPNKEPFSLEKDWADSLTIFKAEKGAKPAEKPAQRWKKGDLVPKEGLVAIPVDPESVGGLAGDNVAPSRLAQALREMHFSLDGRHDDPTRETLGLIKDAEALIAELKKVAIE